ncbi:transmembrane protein 94 isoform X2 [Anthonomus grandis grandis]|uniref:transmembrane protein 94 isoform X2 n=1 Tax=Anthonomus grandis grandis TaxID=2921223 RepID=UPI002165386E|nr:transmembrane protein 94 isoform X2 [Anthonomus grandis grandis]
MEPTNQEEHGLNTQDALNKLYIEIESVLQQFNQSRKSRKSKKWAWIKDTLSSTSRYTTINWISATFQLWASLALILGYWMDGDNVELYEAFIIFVLLIINLSVELYDNKLRHNEIPRRVQMVLDKMKKEINYVDWKADNYPNLFTPYSPCITLQWTYRDGKLVNLPWALLVKDDIILVRPGQISPGYCEALDKHNEYPILHAKEIFAPSLQNANEMFSAPKSRKPLEAKKYRLLETPYLYNLKLSLEEALDRPVTQHNQQRYFVMVRVIECIVLPTLFITVFSANMFRYFYFRQYLGQYSVANIFFISPSNAILPLLPIIFPLVWNISNYVGMARFKTIFDATRMFQNKYNPLEEDTDTQTDFAEEHAFSWKEMYKNFLDICKGKPEILCRTVNILHVLGSVSALACVDKKGILSWPNPTAEKVFFLHNNTKDSEGSETSLNNLNELNADQSEPLGNLHFGPDSPVSASAEVLDLTHNHYDPFRLRFDDKDWQKFLPNLKPLGLAILLNTCHIDTQEHYSNFCSHISCEAMYNEHLVPVTNRRCLCELAKEIGFLDQAQKIFQLEQQLSVFRHLQPEMVRRDNKYARTLQLSTKLKFPFPHAFAVVVKELCSGNMQLLSEGTADIILDCCVDYWDGIDLCPLTHSDRKKIQDFYQRSSLTAYCTAFAYRPLSKSVSSNLSEVYLELPSDSRHLYMNHRSPTPVHWDCKSVLEPKIKNAQFFSTDSLLYNDYPVGNNISDTENCFQMQCNQIFIGMVTMQYQALTDMVQLIEQLERACIRFVHFSKENELRSRDFSEKMGLESGWNCHISLLSDRNSNLESSRTMSFSAPSAINLDHSVVKFDTEVEKFHVRRQSENHDEVTSQDSVPVHADSTTHDWQSLSCLTDSTEQSAPINFDMSNRAKLPRGIDKIRPHIELIDNVPLLVSLFTDCTPTATREMLKIMQDYREVVCILGSSQNCDNAGIFMQADAAISVEPLYPQVCQKMEVYRKINCFSPTDLSCLLNSIACSLTINRSDPISIYHLILEARNFGQTLWSSVQYWLCCCVILSLMQVAAVILMLPELMTTGHNLWLAGVVAPAISIALSMNPVDPDVMKKPQGKIQAEFRWDNTVFILWCYGIKFLPTVITVLICYAGVLASHCQQMCSEPLTDLGPCRCVFFYTPTAYRNISGGADVGGFEEGSWTLLTSRLIVIFIVLLHFVVISAGFVHRDRLFYRKWPHSNLIWLGTVFVLVFFQSIYTIITYQYFKNTEPLDQQYPIPLWVILVGSLSPLGIFFFNELVKKQEITANKRFLRRARLDFGTKLGMNSPF